MRGSHSRRVGAGKKIPTEALGAREKSGEVRRIHFVTNAPGQRPCFSMISSISFMRRIVSFKATTIYPGVVVGQLVLVAAGRLASVRAQRAAVRSLSHFWQTW